MRDLSLLGDRILVQPIDTEVITNGGVYLPDDSQKKPHEGTVVAVGPGKNAPMEFKAGDTVIYQKYGGTSIIFDFEPFTMLGSDGIMAYIDKEKSLLMPYGDQVIAKAIPGQKKSLGGIITPDRSQKTVSQQAIVQAVGRGATRKNGLIVPIEVTIGNRILYREYGMAEIMIGSELYLFIKSNDILAVMEN